MAKGVVYAMPEAPSGLIKIGKTGAVSFEKSRYQLERNSYFNIVGLKCRIAIEVADYDKKEALLDDIFSKSRTPGSELFVLGVDLVIQLLSSFKGRHVFPEAEPKS